MIQQNLSPVSFLPQLNLDNVPLLKKEVNLLAELSPSLTQISKVPLHWAPIPTKTAFILFIHK